jgi:hypothetical protein
MLIQRVTGERRALAVAVVALLSTFSACEASAQSSSHGGPADTQASGSLKPTSAAVTGWFCGPPVIAIPIDFVGGRLGDDRSFDRGPSSAEASHRSSPKEPCGCLGGSDVHVNETR